MKTWAWGLRGACLVALGWMSSCSDGSTSSGSGASGGSDGGVAATGGAPTDAGAGEVWRCADVTGSLGPVICSCEFAPLASQPPDHTDLQCVASSVCCQIELDGSQCVCHPTAAPYGTDCEQSAYAVDRVVAPSCPPPPDFDLGAHQPNPSAPTCSGDEVSCNVGSADCSQVPGSCPTCYHCTDYNVPPSCVAPDDVFRALGTPTCSETSQANIPPESAVPTCSIVDHSDGTYTPLYGLSCRSPDDGRSWVDAQPSCDHISGSVFTCHDFTPVCIPSASLADPPSMQPVLGTPQCVAL